MSENALGGADEIGPPSMLSSQSNGNGSRVGQGDASSNGRPAGEQRTLEVEEEKDATKEAFNRDALAQFLFGPGGRQAGAILLSLGIPGNDGDRTQDAVNPLDAPEHDPERHPGRYDAMLG